jgi:hypothetical protein
LFESLSRPKRSPLMVQIRFLPTVSETNLCVSFVIYLSVSWDWPKAEHPLFEREIKKGRRLQPVGARSDFVTRASTAIFARLDRHRNMLAGEHRLPVLNFIDHDIVDGIGQRRNAGIIECAHRPPADRHASETTTGPRSLKSCAPSILRSGPLESASQEPSYRPSRNARVGAASAPFAPSERVLPGVRVCPPS